MHVMVVAIARTAVQAAADAAAGAAQVAAPGDRADEGVLAARIALAAARSSIIETRTPAVAVEPERGHSMLTEVEISQFLFGLTSDSLLLSRPAQISLQQYADRKPADPRAVYP